MIDKGCIFITKAMFFETRTPKHKPVFVKGRDYYSLTYRYSGRAYISVDGAEYIYVSDSVTFMPKGLSYTTEVSEDIHMAVVHFDFEALDPPRSPVVINAESTMLRALFKALVKNSTDTSADYSKMSIFYEILAELDRLRESRSSGIIPEKTELAKGIIEREYSDPLFSVTELAERIGVSSAYLRREFNKAYGMSPLAYLKDIRIKKAKLLLLSEQYSVARLASECGYTCPSYFIQDFHRATGESPGSYRRRLLDSP